MLNFQSFFIGTLTDEDVTFRVDTTSLQDQNVSTFPDNIYQQALPIPSYPFSTVYLNVY